MDNCAGYLPIQLKTAVINAWATRNWFALGQIKIDEKSNEITAVPELLRLLEIKDCIVTVDALNTQKGNASQIREQGTDYAMALKENHLKPHWEVEGIFDAVAEDDNADHSISATESAENNHGRTETCHCWSEEALEWLTGFAEWRDLKSMIKIEATREIKEEK